MTYPFVEQDLVFYRGDTLRLPLAFKQYPTVGGPSSPIDLTGATVTMTIAWNAGTWGASGSVTKSSPSSGVTIVSAGAGTAEALFSPSDLASVPAGLNARWKVILTAVSGDVRVMGAGDVNVKIVP